MLTEIEAMHVTCVVVSVGRIVSLRSLFAIVRSSYLMYMDVLECLIHNGAFIMYHVSSMFPVWPFIISYNSFALCTTLAYQSQSRSMQVADCYYKPPSGLTGALEAPGPGTSTGDGVSVSGRF